MQMKKIFLTALVAAVASLAVAQQRIELKLYPDGRPAEENGLTGPETLNEKGILGNSSEGGLTVFLPAEAQATGQAVVVCPGGGYSILSMKNEGYDVAQWLNERGIAAVVLKYRMPNGHHAIPLFDVQTAIRTTRAHAAEWGIDPTQVGVMGFSAGGHLASTAATHLTGVDDRPDFAVLIYPVITMQEKFTHKGSRRNLIGGNTNAELVRLYSNELQVTEHTPPTFLALSDDDKGVNPRNSTAFYDALHAQGIPAELHIYPTGGHGWGFSNPFDYRDEFSVSLSRWLKEQRKR